MIMSYVIYFSFIALCSALFWYVIIVGMEYYNV